MSWLKHPRTFQEKRYNQEEWVDGYFIPIRGKRKTHSLPDEREDIFRSYSNNWKRFRKTQYKTHRKKTHKNSSKYALSMSKKNHFLFEHKYCAYKRTRCSFCRKNNIWAEHDKKFEKRQREYEAEKEKWNRTYKKIAKRIMSIK